MIAMTTKSSISVKARRRKEARHRKKTGRDLCAQDVERPFEVMCCHKLCGAAGFQNCAMALADTTDAITANYTQHRSTF